VRIVALWERILRLSRRTPRRLRLCESLPLGERRFVAVVEFEAARFLLGGTPSSLVLLSRLSDAGERRKDEEEPASWKTAHPTTIVSTKRRRETC
jgi:flagellar biogenesis protein FliO